MKKAILLISILLSITIAIDLYWWFHNAFTYDSFQETLDVYLSIFPHSLKDGRLISNLRLLLAMLSIAGLVYLIMKGFKTTLAYILLVINSIVLGLTIFSLM